jgi:hypothetical protein
MGIGEADKLREFADMERSDTLKDLDKYEERAGGFPVVSGGVREFTRERPEDRAALQGLAVLRQEADNVAAALYALAAGLENDIDYPPSVLRLLNLQGYINKFEGDQYASEKGKRSQDPVGNPASE